MTKLERLKAASDAAMEAYEAAWHVRYAAYNTAWGAARDALEAYEDELAKQPTN